MRHERVRQRVTTRGRRPAAAPAADVRRVTGLAGHDGEQRGVKPAQQDRHKLTVGRVRVVQVLDHQRARPAAEQDQVIPDVVGEPVREAAGAQSRMDAGALRWRHGLSQRFPHCRHAVAQLGCERPDLDVVPPREARIEPEYGVCHRAHDHAARGVGPAPPCVRVDRCDERRRQVQPGDQLCPAGHQATMDPDVRWLAGHGNSVRGGYDPLE